MSVRRDVPFLTSAPLLGFNAPNCNTTKGILNKKKFILQQKYCQNFRVNFMKVKILSIEKVKVAFYIN